MSIRHIQNTSGLSSIGGHMKTSKIKFFKSNLEKGKKKKKERKNTYSEGSGKGREEDCSRFRAHLSPLILVGWFLGRLGCALTMGQGGSRRHKGQILKPEGFKQEKEKLFLQAGHVGNGPGCPERLWNLSAQRFKTQPEKVLNNLV